MTMIRPQTLTLRPFTPADYDVFVALSNEGYPEYGFTVDEVRHWDDEWTPDGYFRRRTIADEAGVPVGYAEASNARASSSRRTTTWTSSSAPPRAGAGSGRRCSTTSSPSSGRGTAVGSATRSRSPTRGASR